jgi:protein-L-isoaspartate(D-aspartate) O-methyltransferase
VEPGWPGPVQLRARLVAAIEAAGCLTDPAWRRAFAEVPRHLFVPSFHRPVGEGVSTWDVLGSDDPEPGRRAEWLAACYADQALVTRLAFDGPVSSSSRPSLMALMLEALLAEEGDRVLEIGTGTGYNAALLAHRLGPEAVVTVDLDEELAAGARERLALAGCPVRVVAADGAEGWKPGAPYDRVIGTCSVAAVPGAWIEQCRPGGVVLVPMGSGLLRLRIGGAGHAEGRFLPVPAHFVPLRGTSGAHGGAEAPARPAAEPLYRPRTRTSVRLAAEEGFRFLLDFALPQIEFLVGAGEDRRTMPVTAATADGSVARVTAEGWVVRSGPRDLWTEVERLHAVWTAKGRPGRERYGVSVTPDGQRLWLDDPADPEAIPLPAGG